MIVYDTRAKETFKESVFDKCPNCGSTGSLTIHVFQKYAHVFWIPFFPLGKTGVVECTNCNRAWDLKLMPDSMRQTYDTVKIQAKKPIWMFAGPGCSID